MGGGQGRCSAPYHERVAAHGKEGPRPSASGAEAETPGLEVGLPYGSGLSPLPFRLPTPCIPSPALCNLQEQASSLIHFQGSARLTRTPGRSGGTSDTMLWLVRSRSVAAERFPPALLDMSKADLIASWPEKKKEASENQETTVLPAPSPPCCSPFQCSAQVRAPSTPKGASAAPTALPRPSTRGSTHSPLPFLKSYLKNLGPGTLGLPLLLI